MHDNIEVRRVKAARYRTHRAIEPRFPTRLWGCECCDLWMFEIMLDRSGLGEAIKSASGDSFILQESLCNGLGYSWVLFK